MEAAQQELKSLRQDLKKLSQQSQRIKAARTQIRWPSQVVRAEAVLILQLCDRLDLALLWVSRWQCRFRRRSLVMPGTVTKSMLQSWRQLYEGHPVLQNALNNLEHPMRSKVDFFLMESVLWDHVQQATSVGLVVPSHCLQTQLLTIWSVRPLTPAQQRWKEALMTKPRKLSQYLRHFRRRWDLQHGLPSCKPCMGRSLFHRRVPASNRTKIVCTIIQSPMQVDQAPHVVLPGQSLNPPGD